MLDTLLLKGTDLLACFASTEEVVLENVRNPSVCDIHDNCFLQNGDRVALAMKSSASESISLRFVFKSSLVCLESAHS